MIFEFEKKEVNCAMFSKKSLFFLVIVSPIIAVLFFLIITPKKSENNAHPGFHEQWLYMKTAGSMVLPDVSQYNWSQVNTKRTEVNALYQVAEVGPRNIGGRIRTMLIDQTNPNRIFAGAASGGVWVSENLGTSWSAINDQEESPAVMSIDQNKFNPNILYYCTGEAVGNSANIFGSGVFKSVDGGNTFSKLPSTGNVDFVYCWKMKCSLTDSNTLYVATQSSGLFRSKDAGATFQKVYITSSQINDLETFPDGSVMFTVKGNGIYRSSTGDNGTFSRSTGTTTSGIARIEISYCKNFPHIVYAAISGPDNTYEGECEGFYKSRDGGKTFTRKTNPNDKINFGFTWYSLDMLVKDNDSNAIFIGTISSGYSLNGGNSWTTASLQHSDNHSSYNVAGNKLLVGSDGGIALYNWSSMSSFSGLNNGLNVTQFYAGAVSPHSNLIMGGTQDNGTIQSNNLNPLFQSIWGADGGYCFFHYQNSGIRYISTQNRNILRIGGSTFNISNKLLNPGQAWFIHPFHVNQFNSDIVIIPSDRNCFFSKDRGTTNVNLGTVPNGRSYCATSSLDGDPSVIVGGNNLLFCFDSVISKTNPRLVNLRTPMPSVIKGGFISDMAMVYGKRDAVYLALNNIDDSSRVYLAKDIFTNSPKFIPLGRTLPNGLPVNCIQNDPYNPENVIFAGTDFGIYVTEDGGLTWNKDLRFPNTVYYDIAIHQNKKDIYFFSHGRGVIKAKINNAGTSSITSIENSKSLIFPNPADKQINISNIHSENLTINIFDLNGKLVLFQKFNESNMVFDIHHLQVGQYFVSIKGSKTNKTEKLLICR